MSTLQRLTRLAEWGTYPFLLLSGILLSAMPMVTAFVVPLTIQNNTDQLISVTPVGTTDRHQQKAGLPIMLSTLLPLPAGKLGGFSLRSGEAVTVQYDFDDINFTEIVIEGPNGVWRQIAVDPDRPRDCCYPPWQEEYSITDLSVLEPVTPDVQSAAIDAIRSKSGPWSFLAVVGAPWLSLWLIRSWRARLSLPAVDNCPSAPSVV